MSKRLVAVAFVAAVLGSAMSHYLWPQSVFAELSPAEIRARKFVLVNEQGSVLGTFAEEANGPALKLFDANGREIWFGGKLPAGSAQARSFATVGR
jgi:hypothetical protein